MSLWIFSSSYQKKNGWIGRIGMIGMVLRLKRTSLSHKWAFGTSSAPRAPREIRLLGDGELNKAKASHLHREVKMIKRWSWKLREENQRIEKWLKIVVRWSNLLDPQKGRDWHRLTLWVSNITGLGLNQLNSVQNLEIWKSHQQGQKMKLGAAAAHVASSLLDGKPAGIWSFSSVQTVDWHPQVLLFAAITLQLHFGAQFVNSRSNAIRLQRNGFLLTLENPSVSDFEIPDLHVRSQRHGITKLGTLRSTYPVISAVNGEGQNMERTLIWDTMYLYYH